MSRRRRRDEKEGSDTLSEDEGSDERPNLKLSNATESDIDNDDLDVSEYESVDEEAPHSSEEDEDGQPPRKEKQEKENNEKEVVSKTERESGDGKEQSDSEQHKNENLETEADSRDKGQKEEDDPSFIPTKGAFFQHDLRSENQPKRGRDRRIWDKDPVKWKHDMFIMEEQMPKSRDLLISNYGYDIREIPLDAPPPPTDTRRSRGRGRGGYRGRGRGRFQNMQREQQSTEYDVKNSNYKEDYPVLSGNQNSSIKHKSKSYYKRSTNREHPDVTTLRQEDDEASHDTEKASKEGETKLITKPSASNEEAKDEKFSDILQVINNHESTPTSNKSTPTASSSSRNNERQYKSHQSAFSGYQEAPKPRRYSSLRQRQTNSPVEKQMSSQYSRSREGRYSNFAKPVQPSQSASFPKKSYAPTNEDSNNIRSRTTNKETHEVPALTEKTASQSATAQPPPVSVVQTPSSNPHPVAFSETNRNNIGAPLDPSMMQMPHMPLPYNPMLNPMYLEAATYQRMLRMMSQMNIDQLQQLPTSLPPQMDSTGTTIPPDPQSLPHPPDMQMNTLIPPVSQTMSPGSLGSVIRPPPPPINPPTYFAGPMGMNMGAPQQPFPYPPNLVAQQVGGVTYFNTPTQSPPTLPPVPNQQASPRRNAAIPIMAPTGFGGPGAIE